VPTGGLETPRDILEPDGRKIRIALESTTRYARESNFNFYIPAVSLATDSSRLIFADFRAEVILLGSSVVNRCLANFPKPVLWINGTLESRWFYSASQTPVTDNEDVFLLTEVRAHEDGDALDTGGTQLLSDTATLTLADVNGHSFVDETLVALDDDAETFTTALQRDPTTEADNYTGILYIRGVRIEYFPSVRQ